jgi:hypothetical protein
VLRELEALLTQFHGRQTDLPPTVLADPSENEGISLFFAL